MKVYTFSEARQKFSSVLDAAQLKGAVWITHRDGRAFLIHPEKEKPSPLDVKSVKLDVTREDIVSAVREGRERESRG